VKYSGGVQTHTLTIRAVSLRAAVRKAYDAAQLKPPVGGWRSISVWPVEYAGQE
jgi:hypothetical protein